MTTEENPTTTTETSTGPCLGCGRIIPTETAYVPAIRHLVHKLKQFPTVQELVNFLFCVLCQPEYKRGGMELHSIKAQRTLLLKLIEEKRLEDERIAQARRIADEKAAEERRLVQVRRERLVANLEAFGIRSPKKPDAPKVQNIHTPRTPQGERRAVA